MTVFGCLCTVMVYLSWWQCSAGSLLCIWINLVSARVFQTINTVAEVIRGHHNNQEYFASVNAPSSPPRCVGRYLYATARVFESAKIVVTQVSLGSPRRRFCFQAGHCGPAYVHGEWEAAVCPALCRALLLPVLPLQERIGTGTDHSDAAAHFCRQWVASESL